MDKPSETGESEVKVGFLKNFAKSLSRLAKLLAVIALAATGFFAMLEVFNQRVEASNRLVEGNQAFLLDSKYRAIVLQLLQEVRSSNPSVLLMASQRKTNADIYSYNEGLLKAYADWSNKMDHVKPFTYLSWANVGTISAWFISFIVAVGLLLKDNYESKTAPSQPVQRLPDPPTPPVIPKNSTAATKKAHSKGVRSGNQGAKSRKARGRR